MQGSPNQFAKRCCVGLVLQSSLFLAGAPSVVLGLDCDHVLCKKYLAPNGSFENRGQITGDCEFWDLNDWYVVRGNPTLRIQQTTGCYFSEGIVTTAADGQNWILLRSFSGDDSNWNEAIAVRLTEPLKVGCTYVVNWSAATDDPAWRGAGWLNVFVSTTKFPSSSERTPLGIQCDPFSSENGCKIDADSPDGPWRDRSGLVMADQAYEYLQLRATKGYHVTVDDVRLKAWDCVKASFDRISVDCVNGRVTVDGSASSADLGVIGSHYWEVCEVDESGSGCGLGAFWSEMQPGHPKQFTFPFHFEPCRSYQIKLAVIGKCCTSWIEAAPLDTFTMPGVEPPATMEAWWTGDETAENFAGNKHSGTWEPPAGEAYGPGKVDGAFLLDGSSHIEVPNYGALNFGASTPGTSDGDFSIDAWVQTVANGAEQPIVDKLINVGGLDCAVPCPCDGDFNGDGVVDLVDYHMFAACFQICEPFPEYCVPADLNCDGCVDQFDLQIFNCQYAVGFADPACCASGSAESPVGYEFYVDDDRLALRFGDVGCASETYRSEPIAGLWDGSWHHVAVTVDRDQAGGGKLYFDGVAQMLESGGSSFDPTLVPGDTTNAADLFIGADHSVTGSQLHFDGKVDEVELFLRALSGVEIQGLFGAGECGKCKFKSRCNVPPLSNVCLDKDSVSVVFFICNETDSSQTYEAWADGLSSGSLGGFCNVSGPPSFEFSGPLADSGTVQIAPGQCKLFVVRAYRPADMTAVGDVSCFTLSIRNVATQQVSTCTGAIKARECNFWEVAGNSGGLPAGGGPGDDTGGGGVFLPASGGAFPGWTVRNTGGASRTISYKLTAETEGYAGNEAAIVFDGFSPGQEVTGQVTVEPGEEGVITADVSFLEHLPGTPHVVTLLVDEVGDGSFESVSSAVILSQIPPAPCPEASDFDADGDVDEDDLAIIQDAIGRDPSDPDFNPAADLDLDGLVTFADYQVWWACYRNYNGDPVFGDAVPVGPMADRDDRDADGVPDAVDNCPNASNPGQEDGDGDGFGDVCDVCPADPDKTEPGLCGCGVSDSDSDGDLVPDCNDVCPNTRPGAVVDPEGCPFGNSGDCDRDGDVDGADFLTFSNCFNGALNPPAPGCATTDCADLDGDGDVDGNDFLTFSNCFNGALNPPRCP